MRGSLERRSLSGHCEVATRLGERLGLAEDVCGALAHAYERWDGKGYPAGLAGEDVPLAIRVVAAARDAELWSRRGWDVAREVLARRRGHAHDPAVVDVINEGGERRLGEIGDDPCAAVLDAEPAPVLTVGDLDGALRAVADFTDLKSPFFRAHSSGVAALAADAPAPPACPTPMPMTWVAPRSSTMWGGWGCPAGSGTGRVG